jgi:hypothetical protein
MKKGATYTDLTVGAGQPETVKQKLQSEYKLQYIGRDGSQYIFWRLSTEGRWKIYVQPDYLKNLTKTV